jgi:PAS domain S-box-containing protein
MKIRTKLIIMMLLLGVAFSAIPSVIALNTFLVTLQNERIKQFTDLVTDIRNSILAMYEERLADIKIISSPDHFLSGPSSLGDKMSFLRLLEKNGAYSEIAIYDINGIKIGSTRSIGIGNNDSNKQFFRSAITGDVYFDKKPQYSEYLSSNVIHFAGPIYDKDKKVNGAVVASLPLIRLHDLIDEEIIQEGIKNIVINIDLVASDGEIVYSNHKYDVSQVFPLKLEQYVNDKEIVPRFIKAQNGEEIVTLTTNIQQDGINLEEYIVLSTPSQIAFSEILYLVNLIVLVGIAIFAAAVITILIFSRTISLPIEHITALTKDLAKGKFKQIKIRNTKDEIYDLATSLNRMSNQLLKSQKESFELRRALDESAIVAITDKNGTITYVNRKFCEISKYSEKELIGQNHRILKSGHHPPQFYQNMWETISSGHIWNGDIKNKAKDGTFYWVRTTIVPFLDGEGNPEEYIAIRIDVTEHYENLQKIRNNEAVIKEQLSKLVEIDMQKNEFASMISHELKTPLVPIKGYAEMLQDPNLLGSGLTSPQREAISEIISSSQRLEKLISNVLEIQKLEMDQIQFSYEKIEVSALMKELEKLFKPFTLDKKIKLITEIKSSAIITSDKDKIVEVFTNLVQNAVDFVPKNTGIITISVADFGKYVLFSVADNGPGIPLEKREYIFKKFYQLDTSIARKHGGTGLGLAICKGLVEALNGKIWFDSFEKGTVFNFVLPRQ